VSLISTNRTQISGNRMAATMMLAYDDGDDGHNPRPRVVWCGRLSASISAANRLRASSATPCPSARATSMDAIFALIST
jgi:hypothetical protein